MHSQHFMIIIATVVVLAHGVDAQTPGPQIREVSGVYPHLAFFNDDAECGTGAVVPWAGRLWAITYPPHKPRGSSDKLHEVTPELDLIIRAESVGGTHAGRMIHRESEQLFIGPYVIDKQGKIRVIALASLTGRITGIARHLTNPGTKVYYATMEEGIYEVDVATLEVKELFADDHEKGDRRRAALPGYHGKGLHSGQGRLVYANNGERGAEAQRRPDVPSGCLAEWDGKSATWTVIRRNQFTEVTGPGSLRGADSDDQPIWSIGWDHRSLLLMVRGATGWDTYRLPKGSHSYDGAHGWNTEWPRIRDIGEGDLLMTMHGTFWRFPRSFTARQSRGVAPRSNYLKVIGDFCRWKDRVVFGCDDTARNEFLNKRRAKGRLEGPGQSQSNLWFVQPEAIDALGPPIGRGCVWLRDQVTAGTPSDPFLFSGFSHRGLHLAHGADTSRTFTLEVDINGDQNWKRLRTVTVPAHGGAWTPFKKTEAGAWIRISLDRNTPAVTAAFAFSTVDRRGTAPHPIFDGVARLDTREQSAGLLRARGAGLKTLAFVARQFGPSGTSKPTFYELDGRLDLFRRDDPEALAWTEKAVAIPTAVLTIDTSSVLYVDDDGKRWRLPRGDPRFDREGPMGPPRIDREVATERDLFHAHGTFYELPARNAGGFAKIRPIASHRLRIHDYASYRGLLVLSGVAADASRSAHIVRSADGRAALWTGVVDDLWKLGRPRGTGGPWDRAPVEAGALSDPYLMTGYGGKRLELSATRPTTIVAEVDITGTGVWVAHRSFTVPGGEVLRYRFPDAFDAYWIRFRSSAPSRVTTTLSYR